MKKKIIRKNQIILGLLNIVLFFVGIGSAFFFNINLSPFTFNIHPVIDMIVLAFVFFIMSTLFSGYFTLFIFLYFGLASSSYLQTNPLGMIISLIPLLIASYAGSITGFFASEDLKEKDNLFDYKFGILLLLVTSIILAFIAGLLFYYFAGVDQTKLLPFLSQFD